jgi:NADPH-dependent F420 reductase
VPEHLLITIAVIGGTGPEGTGLALRWARAGYRVIIGSRSSEKAIAHAQALTDRLGGTSVVAGMDNPEAARVADLVVLTVPYEAHRTILEELRPVLVGKILVDVTVPLVPPGVTTVHMPSAGSAGAEAQEVLGEQVSVVSAFQNVSKDHLADPDEPINCDVFVCGNKKDAREQVLKLAEAAGMRGWDTGLIQNAMVAEGLTSILIGINKQYKVRGAGIRIVGVPR